MIYLIPGGLLVYLIMIFIRNIQVCNFRYKLIDLAYSSDNWKRNQEIYHRVDYMEMLLKFWKPLKLESFYTKEEIELLKS